MIGPATAPSHVGKGVKMRFPAAAWRGSETELSQRRDVLDGSHVLPALVDKSGGGGAAGPPGLADLYLTSVSREPPPPLVGGYVLGEQVFTHRSPTRT